MTQKQLIPASLGALLHWTSLAIFFWLAIAMLSPLQAQVLAGSGGESTSATTNIPENLTRDQVRDLVARLSDVEVRQLIISQLDKQATAPTPEADQQAYIGQLREGIHIALVTLSRVFSADGQFRKLPSVIGQHLTDNGRISGWYVLFQFIGLLLAGLAAERLAGRYFKRPSTNVAITQSLGKRFDLACFGLLVGAAQLVAFGAGAAVVIAATTLQLPAAQAFWYDVIWCLVLIKLVMLAARQLASPESSDNRLVFVSDNAARQLLAWSALLSSALILPQPLISIATDSGADTDTALKLNVIFGMLFVGLIVVLVIRLRHYGAALILGKDGEAGNIRQVLARNWWLLAIVYLVVIWLLSVGKRAATGESSMAPALGSLILLAALPFLDQGLKALITWYFSDREPESSAENPAVDVSPAAHATAEVAAEPISDTVRLPKSDRAPAYIATASRYARVIMVLILLMIFTHLWDIDIRAITAQLIGPRVASALFDISITVLLTWALWGMIRISIERKLDEGKPAGSEEGESEAGGLGGSRVETVLPLIRISIKITLVVMAVLISLSSLGVNIGPLIAGAGVVGIAIGFGAQTLVRDIVSGFFYLLDDAFRIGEYVVIDQIRGTVEKISLRSFQLRHHNGPVHTVPYGEIRSLTNWSRDWSIMKFELRIPFETDIDMVRRIIKKIGQEIAADPQFGPLLLAPLKSQGVNRMDDSALIIRCKFTAVPGQQYLIRREAFTRIQREFEAKGIQFAPRRVLVEATTPSAAANAAAAVLDQEVPADGSKPPPM